MITNPILCDFPLVIQTPRLILRPPQAGDGPGVNAAKADGHKEFIYWLGWPEKPSTIEEDEYDARQLHANFFLREDIRYLIINRQSGEIMGRTAFPSVFIDWRVPTFGVSYFLAQRFRKQGFATEAANALTRMAFDVLKARRVEIRADEENIASRNVPIRLGFSLEAKQKGVCCSRGGEGLAEIWTYSLFDPKDLPPLALEMKFQGEIDDLCESL